MATHFSILAWRIPMDRGACWATVYKVTELDTTEVTAQAHTFLLQVINFYSFPASQHKHCFLEDALLIISSYSIVYLSCGVLLKF